MFTRPTLLVSCPFRFLALSLALCLFAAPLRAEEESSWFGSLGKFIDQGLGPAKTVDDMRRDEERLREQLMRDNPPLGPAKKSEPTAAQPRPAAPMVSITPTSAPPSSDIPADIPVTATPPMPAPRPTAAAAPILPTAPAPKPKPIVIHHPPPPEPLISRVAATATLDQAAQIGKK